MCQFDCSLSKEGWDERMVKEGLLKALDLKSLGLKDCVKEGKLMKSMREGIKGEK